MGYLESKRLSEEDLKNVSGGNAKELQELNEALFKMGLSKNNNMTRTEMNTFLQKFGIRSMIYDDSRKNYYELFRSRLSHDELIGKINKGEFKIG